MEIQQKRAPNRTCPICSKAFYVRPGMAKRSKFNTCSNSCRSKYWILHPETHGSNKFRTPIETFFVDKALRLKMSARKRNIVFSNKINGKYLQDLWEKQEGKCHYTNIEMSLTEATSLSLVSVDRIDNDKGYEEGNIVLCCYAINSFKFNFKYEEVKNFINLIVDNHESKDKKIV